MKKVYVHNKLVADKRIFLERLARHLIMHASFMKDLSLYHGKMGIVLFFAHYSRYTGKVLYDDFAGELLEEIYEGIHEGIPINFEAGLCGIGWGIEYLLQKGFMEGDSDEILSDIDAEVMGRDLRRITDYSVRTGLKGISYYIAMRLCSTSRLSGKMPFDDAYLLYWKTIANATDIPDAKQVLLSVMGVLPEGDDILSWQLSLENGCAGVGLKKMWR
jgi:hypothetical protein